MRKRDADTEWLAEALKEHKKRMAEGVPNHLFIVLYAGDTVASAQVIAASTDEQLVAHAVAVMSPSDEDTPLAKMRSKLLNEIKDKYR